MAANLQSWPIPAAALEPAEPAPVERTAAAPARVFGFEFTGDAREFFGIWIVNILLSVITLGIYSAWATVRTRRYFYGHTLLDGIGFDSLAKPTQILKGRLVVAAFFVAWAVLAQLTPWTDLALGLLLLPVIPWAVVRALSFARRYSSYRNIRFGFDGEWREGFGVYILLPVAAVVSLGLLYPYAIYRRRRFQVEHSRFGRTPFAFDGATAGYFYPYLAAFALSLVLFALAAFGLATLHSIKDMPSVTLRVLEVVIALGFALGQLALYVQLATRLENYGWSRTRIGADRFELALEFGALYRIYLTNIIAIALTVGLAIPWAKVRLARYRLARFSLHAAGDLDGHIAQEREQMAALGQELGDALDLDLGM